MAEPRVFEDPRGRRWRAARWIGTIVALGVALLVALLIWGAVMPPLLRPIVLNDMKSHLVAEHAARGRHEPTAKPVAVGGDG